MDLSIIFIWRVIERIIGVIIGGLLGYLGYNLFIKLPDKTDSNGKIILPGNVSVFLSRVGPGVFFALFGTLIVAYSITSPIKYAAKNGGEGIEFSYLSEKENHFKYDEDLPSVFEDISRLNKLNDRVNHYIDRGKFEMTRDFTFELDASIPRIKTHIMLSIWQDEWGEKSEFVKWVRNNTPQPPPEKIEQAAQIYFQK